jgi:hypothetical protein
LRYGVRTEINTGRGVFAHGQGLLLSFINAVSEEFQLARDAVESHLIVWAEGKNRG